MKLSNSELRHFRKIGNGKINDFSCTDTERSKVVKPEAKDIVISIAAKEINEIMKAKGTAN